MYAVFEDGSRQYRVSEGDLLLVDFRDVAKGSRLTFDKVLLYRNGDELQIGQPLLTGARVVADVTRRPTEDDPNPSVKVYVQKFRRRKNYRRLRGHRQPYVEVQIKHILLSGQETPAAPPPPAPSAPAPTEQPAPAQ
jgi:large subunit ribosomal protein L21